MKILALEFSSALRSVAVLHLSPEGRVLAASDESEQDEDDEP